MAKILVADPDLRVQKSILDILAQRDGHHVELHSDKTTLDLPMGSKDKHLIFYASSLGAALELLKTSAFDMAFFFVGLIDDKPDKWVQRIRNHSAPVKDNANLPIA